MPDAKVTPPRNNSDAIAYNLAARRVDGTAWHPRQRSLFRRVLSARRSLQSPANVHYSEAGYEVLAEQVAAGIRATLDSRR